MGVFISVLRGIGRGGIKAALCLALLAGIEVRAEEGAVMVELQGSAPTENILASFDGSDSDGMGWYRDTADWKDVGFSFACQTDGNFRKVTLRLEAVRTDFLEEAKFRLDIYENASGKENPLDGKLVYSGVGRLAIQRSDVGMYLTFDLGHEVPIVSGSSYSVILIWDEPATVVVLKANPNYAEGFSWFRNETTNGRFVPNNNSDRPGLTFYIH